jgi:hypothetical protein
VIPDVAGLSTAIVADACVRVGLAPRAAPAGIRPVVPGGALVAGRALPARHHGSVDVFLEAYGAAGAATCWSSTTVGAPTRRASVT